MKLKAVVAKPGTPITKVTAFGKEYEVDNPLAYFFTSIAGCASYYVIQAAPDLDLDLIEVSFTGEMSGQFLQSLEFTVLLNQPHNHAKKIQGAIENCTVLQHLDPDIPLKVEVL